MGCCGNKGGARVSYEVTFRDGSVHVVDSMMEARVMRAKDTSVDTTGKRREPTVRAVPKAAK